MPDYNAVYDAFHYLRAYPTAAREVCYYRITSLCWSTTDLQYLSDFVVYFLLTVSDFKVRI